VASEAQRRRRQNKTYRPSLSHCDDWVVRESSGTRGGGTGGRRLNIENDTEPIGIMLVDSLPKAAMSEGTKIESVDFETVAALDIPCRLKTVGRLADRMVRPSGKNDLLASALEATARQACEQGPPVDESRMTIRASTGSSAASAIVSSSSMPCAVSTARSASRNTGFCSPRLYLRLWPRLSRPPTRSRWGWRCQTPIRTMHPKR
jgi:hypothetical protein